MDRQFIQLQKTLARTVRAKRKELNLTQEALAFEAEIDRTSVGHIERSNYNPSLQMLCRLADALKVDVKDLLSTSQPTPAQR